jgi:hypothetical protein
VSRWTPFWTAGALCLALLTAPAARADDAAPALPASCQDGVRATVARECGEPAGTRLDALWDAYVAAAAREASCLAGRASEAADAAGGQRAASASCKAELAGAAAREAALEARLDRPSRTPVFAYALGVAGTAAALGGVACLAGHCDKLLGIILGVAGVGISSSGFVVAVLDL